MTSDDSLSLILRRLDEIERATNGIQVTASQGDE
jgi:hypothetical protein